MRALNVLCVAFAGAMHCGCQMSGVGAPLTGTKAGEAKGLRERFELQKDVSFAPSKDLRRDRPRLTTLGVPEPNLGLWQ